MAAKEMSRSPESGNLSVEDDAKPAKNLTERQCCLDLHSPDSGMGNTIFSSPEKSDKDGNDSSDDKDRDGSSIGSPGTPHRIRLARNNIYSHKSSDKSHDNNSSNHIADIASYQDTSNSIPGSSDKSLCISQEINKVEGHVIAKSQSESEMCNENSCHKSVDTQLTSTNTDNSIIIPLNTVATSQKVEKPEENISATTVNDVKKTISSSVVKVEGHEKETKDTCVKEANSASSSSVSNANVKSMGVIDRVREYLSNREKAGNSDISNKGSDVIENSSASNVEEPVNKIYASSVNKSYETKNAIENSVNGNQLKTSLESKRIEGADAGVSFPSSENEAIDSEKRCANEIEGNYASENHQTVINGSSQMRDGSCFEKIDVCNPIGGQNLLSNNDLKTKSLLGVDIDMGIDLDAIRDTDSEAGDSCCSEEQDTCQGGNGCIHQSEVCDPEQNNWDFLMDEEFNVPKKPILNGSAEQLERRSSLKRKATEESEEATPMKCKRGIQFEGVTVFYFPRSQGFTCVPSQGGSTLGMSRRHAYIRQFSLAEHAVEQRRAHREYLLRLRQQRSSRERGDSSSRGSSSEDSEENSEENSDLSDSELDADSYFFLQPLPIRQRRALLRQSGICHIEGLEKEECKDIRVSRELCGCQCKVYCDPDTCECAEAGIRCQVDRHNFPCGCSREGCGNTYGRIEFNPIRVRTHFIHTLMRLEIEKRQYQQHQQQQQWQHQQRAKWLATTSASSNGFSGGSGVMGGNLPFFEGTARDTTGSLAVAADLNKFNSTVEMASCIGSMNAPLYPHFESRQMLGTGAQVTSYVQQDTVGDFNSGTCSVFGSLGSPFDPTSPYGGACHSFPSSSVVPTPPQPQQVVSSQIAPQVVVTPQVASQPTHEPYNSLSKFTNTANLVSNTFPYSGAIVPVNCSNTLNNNFCVPPPPSVHDHSAAAAASALFVGHYHNNHGTLPQNLFKDNLNECHRDFQPNFEALSSSSTSSDKSIRYMQAVGAGTSGNEYATVGAGINGCSSISENNYKMNSLTPSLNAQGHPLVDSAQSDRQLVALPSHSSTLSLDHSNKELANQGTDKTETTENLGNIVKKSIVETVSA